MLSPVALYPDTLLTQVLMASAYPVEIAEADQWIKQKSNLKGDELAIELEKAAVGSQREVAGQLR